MKRIWIKFKSFERSKKVQIAVSIIMSAFAFWIAILNLAGILDISNGILLSIIIVLFCNSVAVNLLEEFHTPINSTRGVILPRAELDDHQNLNDIFDGADEVYLLAIANTGFLKGNGISKINNAIQKGVEFKIVSLHPEFDALKEYEESGIISDTSLPVTENIRAYIRNCKDKKRNKNKKYKFRDKVELRLTTFLLPYSMMIVKKDDKVSYMKIDLYGLDIDYMNRRSFIIPEDDKDNIEFYLNQWDTVWDNAEKTLLVDMSKDY